MGSAQSIIHPELGTQRDWIWRGWHIRYTYSHPSPLDAAVSTQPILLIHGFGSSLSQWYENIGPLSRHRSVYALDLLGFGGSEKAAIAYNSQLWIDQIYDFWQQFIRCPMTLLGHSLGGLVAASVAVEHPEIVNRLILITLPNSRQDMVTNQWLQTSLGSIERIFASPLLVRLIFKVARQPSLIRKVLQSVYIKRDRVTEEVISHYVTPTRDRGAAQTLCRLTQGATRPNYSKSRRYLLRNIAQPTLILWGQRDNVVPLKGSEADIAANPNLKLITIPDAGHCVFDECADQVNGAIAHWLQHEQDAST